MNTTARLDELLVKGSKLSDKYAREAATLLLSSYSEKEESEKVADYLMRFKSSVCLYFFENLVKTPDPEANVQIIHQALCSTAAYKTNTNRAATARGFIIAAVLINNGLDSARNVLLRTLSDVEKEGKYSNSVISLFQQYVVDYCGSLESIDALGKNAWDNPEMLGRFHRFMGEVTKNVVTNIMPQKTDDKTVSQAEATDQESPPLVAAKEKEQTDLLSTNEATLNLTAELIKMLSSAYKEANTLVQSLGGTNGTIALLRQEVINRDSRIAELSSILKTKDNKILELEQKLNAIQRDASEKETRIYDLSEQLKSSLHMDIISKNQELITLKTNLQNSLKVEYSDYLIGKESECNPNNYGALLDSLARIFKTLRRYGIAID